MKKHQNLILPICALLFFSTCKKDLRIQDTTDGTYRRSVTPTGGYEWKFDTVGNFEKWTYGNVTANVSGGSLNVTTVSGSTDPLLLSPDNLGITVPANHKYVRINMKNNSSVTSARIFFTTTADSNWNQARSKSFAIVPNNSYYASYIVDMSTITGWSGTIRRIRVDPLDPAGNSGGQTVNIDYISITEAAVVTNIREWRFDTTGNIEGWTPGNISYTVSGGTLNVTATNHDPLLLSPDNLGITNPSVYKYIHVDMRNRSTANGAKIFFITDADPSWNDAKSKKFAIRPDSSYYGSYIIDMSTVAGWTGTIKQIRFDPLDTAITGQMASIDFIRITDNQSFRGVMSPQYFRDGLPGHVKGFSTGAADTLKNIWKANVIRWQINDPNAGSMNYDAFINSEITELDNAFALCEPLGIKILIDLHYPPGGGSNDSGMNVFKNTTDNAKIISVWQTLATHYKDRTGLYGYGLLNEPIQHGSSPANCDYISTMKSIGNAIRAIDLKTPLFVAAPVGDNPIGFNSFKPFPMTNIVYEVHMYEPHEYTHQLVNSDYPTAYTYPGFVLRGNTYNKALLTTILDSVRYFQTTYSARIFVGEFSAVRWAGGAASYLRDCMEIFEGYGWSWTYHAYKEANEWDLEYYNTMTPTARDTTGTTDRYDQVVGWGLSQNR